MWWMGWKRIPKPDSWETSLFNWSSRTGLMLGREANIFSFSLASLWSVSKDFDWRMMSRLICSILDSVLTITSAEANLARFRNLS